MNKRFLVLLLPLFTAACGFQPMYGKEGGQATRAGAITQNITIDATTGDDIKNKHLAQQLRNDLEDRLRPSGDLTGQPKYSLKAVLTRQESPLAISTDGTISRYSVILQATLAITRASDGALVYQGQARRTGSYDNVSNAFYSTYVSGEDAVHRAVSELAEDVTLQLAAFFEQNPNPQPLTSKIVSPDGVLPAGMTPRPSPVMPLLPGGVSSGV